jgi:hypothetical protein
LQEIKVDEFVRRLEKSIKDDGSRYAFFLGARCSASSGIPTAGNLVNKGLPELKSIITGNQEKVEAWNKVI